MPSTAAIKLDNEFLESPLLCPAQLVWALIISQQESVGEKNTLQKIGPTSCSKPRSK